VSPLCLRQLRRRSMPSSLPSSQARRRRTHVADARTVATICATSAWGRSRSKLRKRVCLASEPGARVPQHGRSSRLAAATHIMRNASAFARFPTTRCGKADAARRCVAFRHLGFRVPVAAIMARHARGWARTRIRVMDAAQSDGTAARYVVLRTRNAAARYVVRPTITAWTVARAVSSRGRSKTYQRLHARTATAISLKEGHPAGTNVVTEASNVAASTAREGRSARIVA
jgi:hypothetical protein